MHFNKFIINNKNEQAERYSPDITLSFHMQNGNKRWGYGCPAVIISHYFVQIAQLQLNYTDWRKMAD